MNAEKLARILQVLSAPARVRIIRLLQDRALCVGALSKYLHVTQGAVSQHLRILRDAGLVKGERRGCYVHYQVNTRIAAKWKTEIEKLLGTAQSTAQGQPKKGVEPCAARKQNVKSQTS